MFKFDVSLRGFAFEYAVYFSLIAKLTLEFGNLLVSSDQIVFICSPENSIFGFDIIYFLCLWLLRLASFVNVLLYLFAKVYGIKDERNYYSMVFEMKFQSIFLLISSIYFVALVWSENFVKTDHWWMVYMDVYIMLAFSFGAGEIISAGYLIQLGFNLYFFGVICCHCRKIRPEVRVEKNAKIAIAIIGIELVAF